MDPDKVVGGRTAAEWDAMSLGELLVEWEARPQPKGPPYRVDREQFARLTRVRSEIFARTNGRPPDGVTYGSGKKRES